MNGIIFDDDMGFGKTLHITFPKGEAIGTKKSRMARSNLHVCAGARLFGPSHPSKGGPTRTCTSKRPHQKIGERKKEREREEERGRGREGEEGECWRGREKKREGEKEREC